MFAHDPEEMEFTTGELVGLTLDAALDVHMIKAVDFLAGRGTGRLSTQPGRTVTLPRAAAVAVLVGGLVWVIINHFAGGAHYVTGELVVTDDYSGFSTDNPPCTGNVPPEPRCPSGMVPMTSWLLAN